MIEIALRFCTVHVSERDRVVETVFPSGHVAGATREPTPENIAQAHEQGYTGEDAVWQSLRDHEILHSLLCEVFFGAASHVMRHQAGAAREILALREWEECFVLAFQRYRNTGEILQPLWPFADMLSEATTRWIEIEVQLAAR